MRIKAIIKNLLIIGWIKKFVNKNPKQLKFLILLYNSVLGFNKIKLKNNKLILGSTILNKTKITVLGENNLIDIEDMGFIYNTKITIRGNNNKIKISSGVVMNHVHIDIEDNHNLVSIGNKTTFYGRTDIAAIESTKVIVGDDCMFSGNIQIRTGDSHSIVNKDGKRINYARDIYIGSHVWLGTNVICLKGTSIPSNCIIGASSLLNKSFDIPNSVIAGNPAKLIKTDINWIRERI
jgi:acetyltransferase-like isoleucine patch superfamily enzyme